MLRQFAISAGIGQKVVLVALVWLSMPLQAKDVLPSAAERYGSPATAEAPDFRRHVVPLFGRLGCNGRSCHGSFQGQGGFRLSLFGYDHNADYQAITGGDQPRVKANEPNASLMLYKPTHGDEHGARAARGTRDRRTNGHLRVRCGASRNGNRQAGIRGKKPGELDLRDHVNSQHPTPNSQTLLSCIGSWELVVGS